MIRDVSYRVAVLRKGGEVSALSWAAGNDPTVYFDASGEIKSSFSGEFYVNPVVDLLSDEIQPILTVDGTEYPLGVFRAATVTTAVTKYGKTVKAEAYDRCWLLKSNKTQTRVHYAKGTSYLTVVQQILTTCGVALAITTASAATLATDREDWEIGTDYLTICNDLLAEINYKPVWFDVQGIAHIEPYTQALAANIKHRYGGTEILRPISADASEETDIFSTPNVFVCVCSNPDLEDALVATAVNESPSSATSTFKRNMRIVQVTKVDNVASQEELQTIANRLMSESQQTVKTISFETFSEGNHGIGDAISIDHPDIGGIYEETAWSITLGAGELMKHTAKRTVIA